LNNLGVLSENRGRFKTGKASLRKSALPQIAQIAVAVISLKHHLKIDGHSDKKPFKGRSQAESDRLNRQLSLRRANAIKAALVQYGVSATRIDTQGHRPDKPLVLSHSEAAYAKNRRVEIGFQK
jgi:outer membrane protein OmpA-like peptidoglycan-associated protein